MQKMAAKKFNDEDMEVVRSSLTILTEITDGAYNIEDLLGELPTEISQTCIMMR